MYTSYHTQSSTYLENIVKILNGINEIAFRKRH